jgi:N-acetylmuramoyl-L-alanine amidase
MLKLSLSAGHGYHTPGKRTPDGMREWEFNSAVVSHLIKLLDKYQDINILRLDDPTGQTDIPLKERSDRSNTWGANVHIDIHANAFGTDWNDANGIETYVFSLQDVASTQLATHIQQNLINATGLKDRGVKEANFHMLRETKAKAKILVEAGFMSNKKEAELLKLEAYRQTVAKAILDAIVTIYNLKKKEEVIKVGDQIVSPFAKEAYEWVVANKISDGSRPQDPITRQEAWVMLMRLYELLLNKSS